MSTEQIRPGTIRYASSEIERILDELDASENHSEMAHNLFKQVMNSEYEVAALDGMIPATVYLADRVGNPELTLSEIEDVSRRDVNNIRTIAKSIQNELGLNLNVQTPEDVLAKRLSNLGLESRESYFQKILSGLDNNYKGSKNPVSVAAALVYAVADIKDLDLTQKEIANEFNVAELTIRNRYPEIIENSSIQFNKENRKFSDYDKAFQKFKDDLDIPPEILELAQAQVTLLKRDIDPAVNKAGVALAAIAEAATEENGRAELKDPKRLASLADVTADTIKKHRNKIDL